MGDTGVLVATHLGRDLDVVGISTKPALVSGQELGTRLADPDMWRRNYLTSLDRFRRLDRTRVVHGTIRSVDTGRKEVHVTGADDAEQVLPYDVLVVASGTTNGFWRQSRVQDLSSIDAEITDVAARIAAAGSIAVVGGGPTGVSAAYNLKRRRPTMAVDLYFGQDQPLPGYHPKVRRRLARELTELGVELHPGHRADLPDDFAADELTTDPIEWSTGQEPSSADLVLWAVGRVAPNTGFLPPDMLDEQGFVAVDRHLRAPGHPDVFAIGDVAATDPHRSSARNFGYRVVVHNVKVLTGTGGIGPLGPPCRMKSFSAPEHRWGSIVGVQDDGMVVHQPNGSSFRVPGWAVQPLLIDVATRIAIYGGVRRRSRSA